MPRKEVKLTEKDVREMTRILEGVREDVENIKSSRQSDATVRLFQDASDTAVASDSVDSVTEVTNPTMIWDDPNRGWDYSEWRE